MITPENLTWRQVGIVALIAVVLMFLSNSNFWEWLVSLF